MASKKTAPGDNQNTLCPLDSEVDAALERLVSQPPLVRSDRLCEFLSYIVQETLAGRGDKIIGYSIGVDVFGKPESFDPTVDTIVRVEASRLRRCLNQYYLEAGADEPVEIIVPKGTYVPEFRYRTGSRIIAATVSPVADNQRDTGQARRGPSIAVLPFANSSGVASDQFFANGLTEETIANLARFKDLFVFSRSTTAKLARDGADVRQLRDELDVDFVVEGSVRKSPQAVRITVQLIDCATDGHILSENFVRPCTPEGVFEIQDEIATLVASRIADRYGPLGRYVRRAHRPGQSKNWETYHWITQFYDYYASHDPERHLLVRKGLTDALEQDTDSSDGWAALSITLLDEYRLHVNERPTYPALEKALEHAQRSVIHDPENAFAYQALALANFHSREFTEFRIASDRAIELNPGHADVLADIGFLCSSLGDFERGLPLAHRAIELSPVHPGWYHWPAGVHHIQQGDLQSAMIEFAKGAMPGFFWYHAYAASLHALLDEAAKAAEEITQLLAVYPEFASNARRECDIWCCDDSWLQYIFEGWRKAGLKVEN